MEHSIHLHCDYFHAHTLHEPCHEHAVQRSIVGDQRSYLIVIAPLSLLSSLCAPSESLFSFLSCDSVPVCLYADIAYALLLSALDTDPSRFDEGVAVSLLPPKFDAIAVSKRTLCCLYCPLAERTSIMSDVQLITANIFTFLYTLVSFPFLSLVFSMFLFF